MKEILARLYEMGETAEGKIKWIIYSERRANLREKMKS